MKRTMGIMLGVAMLLMPLSIANADDWDYMQHDFAASVGEKFEAGARIISGSDNSYWHAEAGINLTEDATVSYRYADWDGIATEHRATLAYSVYQDEVFALTPIVSYHYFDGDGADADFGRLGLNVSFQHTFGEKYTLWVWHEPRFTFAGDAGGFELSTTKSEAGLSVPIGPIQVGPFVQMNTDGDYGEISFIAGTKVVLATF